MKKAAALLLLLLYLASQVSSATTVRWERVPLSVQLIVDQERVIILNRNVRVGLPPESADHLKVQTTDGAIYVTARAPMSATRVQLQDIDDGSVIFLDLTAEPAKPDEPALEPLKIATAPSDDGPSSGSEEDFGSGAPVAATPIPIILTRHAAQSLYAPLRTVDQVAGISAVGVKATSVITSLLPLMPIRAIPLAAWRLQNYWVTAVLLRNSSNTTINLDPRYLQGDFIAATFQHPDLGPANDPTDTTVVYIVTRGHGLRESLPPSISPFSGGDQHAH